MSSQAPNLQFGPSRPQVHGVSGPVVHSFCSRGDVCQPHQPHLKLRLTGSGLTPDGLPGSLFLRKISR